MKSKVLVLSLCFGLAVGLSFATGCHRSDTSAIPSLSSSESNIVSITIPIEGMVCGSCVARTKRALKSVRGVEEVEISLEKRQARVRYDSTQTNPDRLTAIIRELGYKPGTSTETTQ